MPTEGLVRILQSRVVPPPPESTAAPKTVYLAPEGDGQISTVALAAPLTVEVIDPDAAKDSRSSVKVSLSTAAGSQVDVSCVISGALGPEAGRSGSTAQRDAEALQQGRFLGQVILQLGGKGSPQLVPLTSAMPRRLIGGPELGEDSGEDSGEPAGQRLVARVLNVTGADVIAASYRDQRRPDGKAMGLEARARLVVDGRLDCTDRTYEHEVRQLHVGEKMFLMVTDADRDASDKLDSVSVEIATASGERETVALVETLGHSGVFTGSFLLKPAEKPTPGNLDADDPAIEAFFGDTVRLRYVDPAAVSETGQRELTTELPVVIGTNGVVRAFTKAFGDEGLAVETKFHVAESYFELFKSHRGLGREKEAKEDLEAGRRVLREVMEDHRDPKYAPRVAYLLGQFAQELQQWDEAIESYDLIIRRYPDHSLAADAQYKLAQCHEQAGDFDRALEAYVTLAATYPKSPLIASIMIRISDHFYKQERYEVAAQVAERFLATFAGHQHAPRIAFRSGQCYYKAKQYREAAESFDRFTKTFPDDKLCADALFWSGESYRQARNNRKAFERYNLCRWDYPESEAAKYARGRLALPEMLRQFEADSKSLNPDQ